jgi:diguanylate cyclase (GGDEF)-like protein
MPSPAILLPKGRRAFAKIFRRSSLRLQIALILMAAMLPLLALRLSTLSVEEAHILERAADRALDLARAGAVASTDVVDEARTTLDILSQLPAIHLQPTAECSHMLQRITQTRAWAAGIYILDQHGTVMCSSSSQQMGLNIADRNYVREALATRTFATSDYIVGKVSRQPMIGSALPVFGPSGELNRILVATISTDWLTRLAEDAVKANPGSQVMLIDGSGVVLAQAPNGADAVGKPVEVPALGTGLVTEQPEVRRTKGPDGDDRIFGITPVPRTRAHLVVGLSAAEELSHLAHHRRNALLDVLLSATVTIGLIWFYLRFRLIRPMDILLDHAADVGAGRLGTRIAARNWPHELSELGSKLNAMTAKLERHSAQQAEARRELLMQSMTDPLTGIANRRGFDAHFGILWQEATAAGKSLGILMLDADHFKSFNDRYGHGAGDEVLAAIGELLAQTASRTAGFAARLGGEEFALILPGSDEDAALVVADRLCRDMAERNLTHQASTFGCVTVSIGAASVAPTADTLRKDLLEAGDAALYLAKSTGRNRAMGASRLKAAMSGHAAAGVGQERISKTIPA